jgi:hypothetical protein
MRMNYEIIVSLWQGGQGVGIDLIVLVEIYPHV